MPKSKLVETNEAIAETVTRGFSQIEKGVVEGYGRIQDKVVEGYTRIEDKFVEAYLTREGETVAGAKERLRKEREQREEQGKSRP